MAKKSPPAHMYKWGRYESLKIRTCDAWDCACTLTYWDRRLGKNEHYYAFLDGWSDAANGSWELAELHGVKAP